MIHVARESQCPQLKFYVLPISDRIVPPCINPVHGGGINSVMSSCCPCVDRKVVIVGAAHLRTKDPFGMEESAIRLMRPSPNNEPR